MIRVLTLSREQQQQVLHFVEFLQLKSPTVEFKHHDGTMAVIQGSENVFEDLGFDTEEAANLKVRADLMLKLRQYILECGWTQEQAANFFGETQPRMSNLMNGEIGRFSVDKLINMLVKAGMQVTVDVV